MLHKTPYPLIPFPTEVKYSTGYFEITPATKFIASETIRPLCNYFNNLFSCSSGFELKVYTKGVSSNNKNLIKISINSNTKAGNPESYTLSITKNTIFIQSSTSNGIYYGIQTLRQLIGPDIESQRLIKKNWLIPCLEINDKPKFKWRGMHLDVGRHLFSLDEIKKYIELISYHKMNKFHWHLTEDQGWRIEIKKYPELTQIGSKRSATPLLDNKTKLDGKPYGGFYTQEEIKEVIKFANSRFVEVIPEIEMPGHSKAVLATYPELGCIGKDYHVRTYWGVDEDVFCAGNEKVYELLENILLEVIDLFSSKYIHIGGDECPKERWKKCPKCQSLINRLNLKNEHELQSYFIKRIEKFLNSRGRQIIGWDEILEGGLAPNATVMSWRGFEGGLKAAKKGNNVIMTPVSNCYLDKYQTKNTSKEPPAITGIVTLKDAYNFNPIPNELNSKYHKYIIGGQGNLWTEYINSNEQLEYMLLPRQSALAERLWSTNKELNFLNYLERLKPFLKIYRKMKVNFRDPFV